MTEERKAVSDAGWTKTDGGRRKGWDVSDTPRTDALARAHYNSSAAHAAGMGQEIPCEVAYVEMRNLADALEREVAELRAKTIEECATAASYHSRDAAAAIRALKASKPSSA